MELDRIIGTGGDLEFLSSTTYHEVTMVDKGIEYKRKRHMSYLRCEW